MKKFLLAIFAIVVIGCVYSCGSDTDTKSATTETETMGTASMESATPDVKDWAYDTTTDKMTDKAVVFRFLDSDNTVMQDEIYGETGGTIAVRSMNGANEVMFSIENGQIVGNDIDGSNYVNVRFDGEQPVRYYYNECNDLNSTTVFLKNAKKFIEKAKTAKRILIEVALFEAGNKVFEFSCDKSLTM